MRAGQIGTVVVERHLAGRWMMGFAAALRANNMRLIDGMLVVDQFGKMGLLVRGERGWDVLSDGQTWRGQSAEFIRDNWRPAEQSLVVEDEWYEKIDVGIRFAVRILHAAGIETCQSCEGGPGHAYDRPTIDLPAGNRADGFAALAALASYGLDVLDVAILWPVISGLPSERIWRITLRQGVSERAEERPIFVLHARST